MSRKYMRFRDVLAFLTAAAVLGCSPDPFEVYRPPTVSVGFGQDQSGAAGLPLHPFRVRVSDSKGDAVDRVDVAWVVTSGTGLFRLSAGEGRLVASVANLTDQGIAEAVFVPTSVGENTVTAYASGTHGFSIGSVTFSAYTDAVAIPLDESIDWSTPWPSGAQDVVVDVGTPVRWRPARHCCFDRVRSLTVPAGGAPFDTVLTAGDTAFTFVPSVAGTWTWVWDHEVDDWDAWLTTTVSDTATLVVR